MYLYELHAHSCHGSACGVATIEDLLRHFKGLGYAGLVITEHFLGGNTAVDRTLSWEQIVTDYSYAWREGQTLARELDMDLLFGLEEGYGKGKEFLVYGIEPEFLLERPFLRRAPVEVWSREVHEAGGVLIYAHPFRDRDYITDPLEMPDMRLADGVEIWNRANEPEANARAEAVFGGSGCILTAGSDAHNTTFPNPVGVLLPRRAHTGRALAQMLRSRDFSLRI